MKLKYGRCITRLIAQSRCVSSVQQAVGEWRVAAKPACPPLGDRVPQQPSPYDPKYGLVVVSRNHDIYGIANAARHWDAAGCKRGTPRTGRRLQKNLAAGLKGRSGLIRLAGIHPISLTSAAGCHRAGVCSAGNPGSARMSATVWRSQGRLRSIPSKQWWALLETLKID